MLRIDINFNKKEIFNQSILVLIIASLYFLSLHYPIYNGWDDKKYILENPYLSFSFSNVCLLFSKPYYHMYTPLTMLSYMFDYNVWGLNSCGYHLQNIFWHIIASIIVYKCFRLFEIKSWIAFFLCLIFAVHPQRVESVVWLSERKDVLCAAFYFLSIYYFLKSGTQHKRRNYTFSMLFYIFALLSKPMAVSLPVILLLYEFYRNKKDKRLETVDRRLKKKRKKICGYKLGLSRLWPYFIILTVFIPLTTYSQALDNAGFRFSFRQLYVVLYNIKFYITTTIIPTYLNPIYPRISISDTIVSTSVFYIATVFIIIFFSAKDKKFFLYYILSILSCYIIALLPVVGIVPFSFCNYADRWSYIPTVFIWFAIGLILTRTLYKNNSKQSFLLNKQLIFALLVLYSVFLIILNYQYQKVWENRRNIFLYASSSVPANRIALKFLADLELEQGNYVRVLKIADQLEEEDKGSLDPLYFKATVTYYLNKKKAIKQLLFIKPYYELITRKGYDTEFRYLRILNMLIDTNYFVGNIQKAIEYINELLSFKHLSKNKRYFYHGVKAYCLKEYKTAILWFNKALELEPNNKKILGNIQFCLEAQKGE
jgi:protein O-mannosyl-transferase